MNSEKYLFTPLETVQLLLKRWWLLVLFMLLGAGAGWLFHSLQAPVYEAKAIFAASIDFSNTGELSELQEDMIIVLIGDVIKSTPVMEELIAEAEEDGIVIDPVRFEESKFLERSNNHWVLIVRDADPEKAARLVNLWADTALAHLNTAFMHSLSARAIESELEFMNGCLEGVVEDQSENLLCDYEEISQLQNEIDLNLERLETEKALSQGLLAESSAALVSSANIPKSPILFGQNSVVLFGSLAGLVLGLVFMFLFRR